MRRTGMDVIRQCSEEAVKFRRRRGDDQGPESQGVPHARSALRGGGEGWEERSEGGLMESVLSLGRTR